MSAKILCPHHPIWQFPQRQNWNTEMFSETQRVKTIQKTKIEFPPDFR